MGGGAGGEHCGLEAFEQLMWGGKTAGLRAKKMSHLDLSVFSILKGERG